MGGYLRGCILDMYVEEKIMLTIRLINDRIIAAGLARYHEVSCQWCIPEHGYLCHIGYIFQCRKWHYEYTKESDGIIYMRENYLVWIKRYRDEGYQTYYKHQT